MTRERFYIIESERLISGPHTKRLAGTLVEPGQKIVTADQIDQIEALRRRPGRPPAAGTQRQVRISATVPPEYADWLRERGDISEQIRAMIERSMNMNIQDAIK